MSDPFPLGRPGDDVEAAAVLYVRYAKEHPLSPDLKRSFLLMCPDGKAVLDRVMQMKRFKQEPGFLSR